MKLSLVIGAVALALAPPLSASAQPRGDEPIPVPRTVKQGIDFVYVDPDLSNIAKRHQRPVNWLLRTIGFDWGGQQDRPNPLFLGLARGLQDYQVTWGRLPQVAIAAGPALKAGSTGRRVALLRARLGLSPQGSFDEGLTRAVKAFQQVHGLDPVDGIAGRATIEALNRGANFYARRIAINMERAHRLPTTGRFGRYVVVDSGGAEVLLFDRDRVADKMRAVVGSPKTKTPMMAVIMRDAKVNPYWNVPPELVHSLTAKRIMQDGLSYLKAFHYEVLSDWSANAHPINPKAVDWKAIASGREKPTIRVRQLPGPWNSMGEMKFEMPNDYGIYLHDTPHKELFAQDDRWVSNGCVRLQDYRRFASWIFGSVPQSSSPLEQTVPVPRPVPVFMTYLTAVPGLTGGVQFRDDRYGFDRAAMAQMFGGSAIASAS